MLRRTLADIAFHLGRGGLRALLAQLRLLSGFAGLGGFGRLLLGALGVAGRLHVGRQFERALAAAAGERAGEQRSNRESKDQASAHFFSFHPSRPWRERHYSAKRRENEACMAAARRRRGPARENFRARGENHRSGAIDE